MLILDVDLFNLKAISLGILFTVLGFIGAFFLYQYTQFGFLNLYSDQIILSIYICGIIMFFSLPVALVYTITKRIGKESVKWRKYQRKQSDVCPKCGPGNFLTQHSDRVTCDKCRYIKFHNS